LIFAAVDDYTERVIIYNWHQSGQESICASN